MILKINDRIRTRKVEFFSKTRINLAYDKLGAMFGFEFYFDPNVPELKEMACVGHYHICTIEDNNELLITGYVLSEAFNSLAEKQLVSIGGYSLPGVLADCKIPPIAYPLQSDGLTLKEIATKYIAPFKLGMVIAPQAEAAMNEPYEEATAKESQTVQSFLSELASQKNIIMSHDARGNVLFTKTVKQKPIYAFERGQPGVTMGLKFNGQGMHSEITVARQEDIEEEGSTSAKAVIYNPYVPYVYRPDVIIMSSTHDADADQAAKNALAKELKNLSVEISIDTWYINNKIIRPGVEVSAFNPDIYLFKKTNLFVDNVELIEDKEKKVAKLTCVLPECYNGDLEVAPATNADKYIFKGINLH